MVGEILVGMVLVIMLIIVLVEIIQILIGLGLTHVLVHKQVVTVTLCKVVDQVIAHGGMAAAAEAILVVAVVSAQVTVIKQAVVVVRVI